MSNFRSSKFLEKYNYITYDLDTPIIIPANNQFQKTKGYKFSCDNTNDTSPYDWFNAYFEIDFEVQKKADASAFVAADRVSCVNSVYSLLKRVSVNYNGTMLNDTPNLNWCAHVKNLLEYTEPHKKILSNSFYYLDESASTVVAYPDFAAIKASGFKESAFKLRHDKIITLQTNNVLLSLSRYGFFESLQSQICPQGRVIITIELESSDNLIYSDGAVDDARIILTKMKLHVPQLKFNSSGEQLFLKTYLNPHEWSYFDEHLEISPSSQVSQGSFLISSAISKPRHVFIWTINDNKLMSQHHNIFFHDTFSIAYQKKMTSVQLEVGSGNFYPVEALNPDAEISLAYRMLMSYNRSYNDYLTGSQLDLNLFKKLYGLIYFDLRNQPIDLRNGITKLTFKWQIDSATNAGFSWYALVLSEESIKVVSQSGKVFFEKISNIKMKIMQSNII